MIRRSLRRSVTCLVASLAILTTFATDTSAQLLEGQWFKLNVSSKGVALGTEGPVEGGAFTPVDKAKMKFTMYMFLQTFEPEGGAEGIVGVAYDVIMFYEQSPGNWQQVSLGDEGGGGPVLDTQIILTGENERFMQPAVLRFLDNDSTVSPFEGGGSLVGFDGYWSAEFKVKLDKEGALKSASIKSLGGTVVEGGVEDGRDYGGGFTVKGKLIPPSKLPFKL